MAALGVTFRRFLREYGDLVQNCLKQVGAAEASGGEARAARRAARTAWQASAKNFDAALSLAPDATAFTAKRTQAVQQNDGAAGHLDTLVTRYAALVAELRTAALTSPQAAKWLTEYEDIAAEHAAIRAQSDVVKAALVALE